MSRKKKTGVSLWQSALVRHAVYIVCVLTLLLTAAMIAMRVGTRHDSHRTVPDFTGMKLAAAQRAAQREGLEIIVNDSLYVPVYDGGTVLDQLPDGGTQVKAGRKIYVVINSFHQKRVPVPYVAGRSLRQARNMLEVAGFEIERLVYVDDIATNYVLGEWFGGTEITPESTLEAEMGSGVTLRVGVEGGYGTAAVPKVLGLTLSRAKSRLWEMGFNVGSVVYDEGIERTERRNARVWSQSVEQARTASLGTEINLHLTLDGAKVERCVLRSDSLLQSYLRQRAWLEEQESSQGGSDDEEAMLQQDASSDDDDDDFFM